MTTRQCNCYMLRKSDEIRFTARYGAHDCDCPVYRESLDPVDQRNDAAFRAANRPMKYA